MKRLTYLETARQDFVDGEIFKLLLRLAPTSQPIQWNIEMIGEIRDNIENWIVTNLKLCTEREFYPFIEESDGN